MRNIIHLLAVIPPIRFSLRPSILKYRVSSRARGVRRAIVSSVFGREGPAYHRCGRAWNTSVALDENRWIVRPGASSPFVREFTRFVWIYKRAHNTSLSEVLQAEKLTGIFVTGRGAADETWFRRCAKVTAPNAPIHRGV